MRRRCLPLSPFGKLLTELCSQNGYTLTRLGRELELTSYNLIGFAVRPHRNGTRAGLFSPDQIDRIAEIFECDEEIRLKLHILSAIEYAPAILSRYIEKIEGELRACLEKDGEPIPVFVITGDQIERRVDPRAAQRSIRPKKKIRPSHRPKARSHVVNCA